MNQKHFTRHSARLPDRYYAIKRRAYLVAVFPLVWVKAARIVRDRMKPEVISPEPNRYGMVYRGKFRSWEWLKTKTVCRKCHKPIGQPVLNPKTGEIDHEGISCYGKHEHIIKSEGDLMLAGQYQCQVRKQQEEAYEVLKIYAPPPKTGLGKALYPALPAGLD
jgi:hypothetical protein